MSIHRTTLLLAILILPSHAATLFVSPDGDGTDGLSWESAFPRIRDAVVASATGDEIWIKATTYTENISISQPVTLLGGFLGNETLNEQILRDPEANQTVIDGNRSTTSIVKVNSTIAEISGVVIKNGRASSGSGMRVDNSTVTIEDVIFLDNGAMPNTGSGGGLRIRNSTCDVWNCQFTKNSADVGGGISVADSTLHIRDSLFSHNIGNVGGGMTVGSRSTVEIESCVFRENVVIFEPPDGGLIGFGGQGSAIHVGTVRNFASSLLVQNSIFDRNFRENIIGGGTIFYGMGRNTVEFDQCTCILGGSATGFALAGNYPHPQLTNCIVVGEPGQPSRPIHMDEVDATYCLIDGGYSGEGNIDGDPKFVDIENGDYHLERSSPCIDSGTDTGLTTDFDGNPRPVGDYDMGAFEFPTFRGDIDGDGNVDAMDLMIFQQDWGKVSGL